MATTRHSLNPATIKQLIAQRVAHAMTAYKANRNRGNGVNNETCGSARGVEHTVHNCSYKEFLTCKPYNFQGTGLAVGLSQWFEKMEYVFHIFNFAENCQVKYPKCTSLDGALTWWNSYVQSVGLDVANETTWKELK
ncbi:hypothetical protein Tco_0651760 [Tanacetum coccineum]|uniref:Reverse transcriptase domain-containing protein n=1 Tax=Tanacetum coccineum TaxID=301880 RepID=A0ABQ4WVP6_9ASTR